MRNIVNKLLFVVISCLMADVVVAKDVTFSMTSIFDGTNTSATVTSPVAATITTTSSKKNADDGKLDDDERYFQIVLASETFTAASINGYINTTKIDKNWAFQFSTDGGNQWSTEVTQSNDGQKSDHDIAVNVSIPNGANGFRVIRRAGTSTYVRSVTFTLGSSEPVHVTGVTVSPTSLSISQGKTSQLTATVQPSNADNQNVTWSSNNTAVATVSATGLVTAIAQGTAKITVTTVDGNKTAECTVTVTEPAAPVPVTGVTLNKNTLELKVGGSETLTATVQPTDADNQAVSWSSTPESVATVDANGKVTAVAVGTATITVTTQDGNKTDNCTVTVSAADPVPSSDLAIHVPEVYEAKEVAGGYGGTLTTYQGREYEVYYFCKINNVIAVGTDPISGNIAANSTSKTFDVRDHWMTGKCNEDAEGGTSKPKDDSPGSAEFKACYGDIKMGAPAEVSFHISGFDEFAIYALDNNTTPTGGKNRWIDVYVDNMETPVTKGIAQKPATVRRYSITTGEHLIKLSSEYGGNKLFGLSLRLAEEPRTKWLKGNDSTQAVLQTTAIKPVYYYTKYNSKGETKLVWNGPEATGIGLIKSGSDELGDTLVLSGQAQCAVGTYKYNVISYYNGQETNRVSGKFTVKSEIKALTDTIIDAYQDEEMDAIIFQYYALEATDVSVNWTNSKPAWVNASGKEGKYTISGTPTTTGTYDFTISVTGGNSIQGSIIVHSSDLGVDPILYLYKNNLAYNKDGVYTYLTSTSRNLKARKAKMDGLRTADQYAKYKWILISEDVDADNPEILALARGEGNLPVLSMKSFSYTPDRLDWGEPDNGSLTQNGRYITVQRNDHPIFQALGRNRGDKIQVLDTVVGKGLMPIDVNYTGTICLATALTRDINDYYGDGYQQTILHEVPAKMHNGQKYLCFPMSAEGSQHLNAQGKRLLDECINYILGNQATVTLPTLAITDFKIGNYVGDINEADNIITLNVMSKDANAMKAAKPKIALASPMTFVTPNDGEEVDFSNWHFGVQYVVSDYINKRYYTVMVNLYDPQGIENVETCTWVNIYDIYGRKVTTTNEDLRTIDLPTGMYIVVTSDGQTIKIMR